MPENKGIVSVVIPCRNEKNYIGKCLQSMIDCDYPKELLQVIVCDGMSDDGTRDVLTEYAEKYPFIHWIENKDRITPKAMNLGIRHFECDYVLIIGAHSQMDRNYISLCKEILDKNPEVGCVGGQASNIYDNETSEAIGLAMSSPFGVGNAHFRTGSRDGEVDTVGTPFYRRQVLEETGLFNEVLVRNQDDELNYRVKKAGYKIWLTFNTGHSYYVRASFSKLFRQYYQYGYWKVYVNHLHKTVTTIRQLVPAVFLSYLVLGLVVSLLFPVVWPLYLSFLVIYIFTGLFMALQAGSLNNFAMIWWAFCVLHISYGYGYLRGMLDFVVLGRKPQRKASSLTR